MSSPVRPGSFWSVPLGFGMYDGRFYTAEGGDILLVLDYDGEVVTFLNRDRVGHASISVFMACTKGVDVP